MKRPCLGCGRLIPKGSYCRRCASKRKRVTPGRRGAAAFRKAVLSRSGGRCEVCGSADRVEAHHRFALRDGGSNDPANGVALCRAHHERVEAALRRRRRA